MFSKKQLLILNLLLIAGGVVALKLLHIDYMVNFSAEPYQSFCNINAVFNCDAVAASSHSHILGIPIALIGTLANFFLIGFLRVASKKEIIQNSLKPIFLIIFALYALGCLSLAAITFFLSPSICIMCIVYWAISGLTLIYLWVIARDFHHIATWQKWFKELPIIIKEEWRFLFGALLFYLILLLGIKFSFFTHNLVKEQNVSRQNVRPYLGLESAPLEVVLYSDFQCPACRSVNARVERLAHKYGEKVRFVRREFPLDKSCNRMLKYPLHELACRASYYAKCAGQQGLFWDYHQSIYENQDSLSEELLQKLAQGFSLNRDQLVKCVDNPATHKAVALEIEEGIHYKIDGTPSMRLFAEIFTPIIKEEILEEYIQNYPEMPVTTFKRYYDNKFNEFVQLIDIRTTDLFKTSHLQGAISWKLLQSEPAPLQWDKSKPTLIYDQNGHDVAMAYKILKDQGFTNLMMLKGGIEGWQTAFPQLNMEKK